MAYSSVRVQFEIGHEALVRTKKTPEGFTHDWEVFVRGADNTDIQYFVEKVIFHLHETFPKPKRVIKEPPYVVKESGYAGFLLPIDVYLKNKEEPKKISFQYDLTLQTSGPPVSRVLREPRLFQNPSEDFRLKLIRGGGVGVDTPTDTHHDEFKSLNSLSGSKMKMGESVIKKHKPDLPPNDSFAELFGPPIRRVVEPKKLAEISKKLPEVDPLKDKKKTSKHGSYKEEMKKAMKEKEKYVDKGKSKEQEKSKEKSSKRPPSPSPPAPQVFKSKDDQKKHEEWKKKEHEEKKKRKEEREKKEKAKDVRTTDKPFEKEHKKDKKESKDFNHVKKINSLKLFESKPVYEKHNNENVEREKERIEKEKHKHRHKKKDKEKTKEKDKHRKDKEKNDKEIREKQREKEKNVKKRHEEIREKEEKIRKKSRSPSPPQEKLKKKPLNALLDELGSSDSASPLSEDEAMLSKLPAKVVPEIKSQSHVNVTPKLKSTNLNPPAENKTEKEIVKTPRLEDVSVVKSKKEKSSSKKNKKSDKDNEKRRIKEEHSKPCSLSSEKEEDEEEEGPEKNSLVKEEKERLEADKPKLNKDKENRKRKRDKSEERHSKPKKTNLENSLMPPQSIDLTENLDGIPREDKFTQEYVAQLRDLQHKIMTLDDIAELQKVVKVIAETGQYEITQKTFDFDLCALDSDTVRRLQEFFAPT